ncbi:hypothetical protein [Neisseria sp. oral taxon 014]|uniref:hypothetical protein n=1 Tax=Neisseria sp. oral taxon 014 TaxID=641148 RepID=UPI0025CE5A6D|nr:hypothetical protein [Neisseria sp. oral taxon 014]
MRKVSALFLAIAMAASVNVQAAPFLDWLFNGRMQAGLCACSIPNTPCGNCGLTTR